MTVGREGGKEEEENDLSWNKRMHVCTLYARKMVRWGWREEGEYTLPLDAGCGTCAFWLTLESRGSVGGP